VRPHRATPVAHAIARADRGDVLTAAASETLAARAKGRYWKTTHDPATGTVELVDREAAPIRSYARARIAQPALCMLEVASAVDRPRSSCTWPADRVITYQKGGRMLADPRGGSLT
jgi:hypothetical protein